MLLYLLVVKFPQYGYLVLVSYGRMLRRKRRINILLIKQIITYHILILSEQLMCDVLDM